MIFSTGRILEVEQWFGKSWERRKRLHRIFLYFPYPVIFRRSFEWWRHRPNQNALWRHYDVIKKRVKMKYRPNMVVWYINGKLWFQRFQIWNCFWPMTSSRDVIKEKPLKMGISGRFYHSTLSFDICYRTILSWNSSYIFYTTFCVLPW